MTDRIETGHALPTPLPSAAAPQTGNGEATGWRVVFMLGLGYIGIYLCRKNFSVAVPLLQQAFHATKAQVGSIASAGTIAYATGKIITGPIVDRIGGRRGFLLAIVAVACFGAAGAFAPGLGVLALLYGMNRFAGAAGWGAMLKLVPSWFGPERTGTVVGVLSLSYVAGGVFATLLARQIVGAGGGWQAVMGVPSAFAVIIGVLCFLSVRRGPLGRAPAAPHAGARARDPRADRFAFVSLFRRPQFFITCALSFTVTLMRESFNTWSVDFLVSVQGNAPSVMTASLHSTGFDLAGLLSIFLAGIAYDRLRPDKRRWLISGSLFLLAIVIALLPSAGLWSPILGAVLVGAAGLLVYGPYSLLAGTLAVENGGAELAATAAGIIDGVGYVAGALAGVTLGRLLDIGGYALGFGALAVITAVSAVVALALHPVTPAAAARRS